MKMVIAMDRHFVKHFLTFGCFMVFRWPWRAESIPFIKLCNFVTFRNLGHVERNAMRASSIFQPGLSVFGHPSAQVMKTSVSDFSRMRSKGSRFTLGVWGLRLCSLDVAFTIATVRNRSRDPRMAVPMGSSAGGVLFGGFRRVVASFRAAGVALRDIQTCSGTCRKSFCVAGAILLRRFQKMCCSFRGRRSTLDVSIVIFRGRRSTLDVSCCVFFANRIGRAASSGDEVQIPWQSWHFVRCAEN